MVKQTIKLLSEGGVSAVTLEAVGVNYFYILFNLRVLNFWFLVLKFVNNNETL